jgi:hypothetical protein
MSSSGDIVASNFAPCLVQDAKLISTQAKANKCPACVSVYSACMHGHQAQCSCQLAFSGAVSLQHASCTACRPDLLCVCDVTMGASSSMYKQLLLMMHEWHRY